MLLTLSEWYRPEVIFKYATICYVRREKDPETTRLINEKIKYYQEHYSARIMKIETNEVKEISSSDLRRSLMEENETDLLPLSVLSYIKEKGFYK
jgi:nicotinate-nucleotide adenylyltransferase